MARKTASRIESSIYSIHPAVQYVQSIVGNLPETTGKNLAEWLDIVKKSGSPGEKARRDWLKREHGLGHTTANLIAEFAEGKNDHFLDEASYLTTASGYVETMYSGPKASLRPIHDALIALALSLGSDVRICPCQTIVPLYRHHVFAQIKPATRSRIDLGFALKNATELPGDSLIDTGGLAKGDRITHRLPITSVAEIDDEVKTWLRRAYELDREK